MRSSPGGRAATIISPTAGANVTSAPVALPSGWLMVSADKGCPPASMRTSDSHKMPSKTAKRKSTLRREIHKERRPTMISKPIAMINSGHKRQSVSQAPQSRTPKLLNKKTPPSPIIKTGPTISLRLKRPSSPMAMNNRGQKRQMDCQVTLSMMPRLLSRKMPPSRIRMMGQTKPGRR